MAHLEYIRLPEDSILSRHLRFWQLHLRFFQRIYDFVSGIYDFVSGIYNFGSSIYDFGSCIYDFVSGIYDFASRISSRSGIFTFGMNPQENKYPRMRRDGTEPS